MSGSSEGCTFEQWELDAPTRPRFGRCWWFWLPKFSTNGGRFKPHQNTDWQIHWLCWVVSLTVYAWKCSHNEES